MPGSGTITEKRKLMRCRGGAVGRKGEPVLSFGACALKDVRAYSRKPTGSSWLQSPVFWLSAEELLTRSLSFHLACNPCCPNTAWPLHPLSGLEVPICFPRSHIHWLLPPGMSLTASFSDFRQPPSTSPSTPDPSITSQSTSTEPAALPCLPSREMASWD